MPKAITLISGGLDSILAARVIKDMGIEVIPVNFKIPFCHNAKINVESSSLEAFVKRSLGVELRRVDIRQDFLEMLKNPRYGFGSNMNPCIDCKILMLRKAKDLFSEFDAKFIVTGEVLGQRPMSQNKAALQLIPNRAGVQGLVVRPLSAKLLEQTIPEKEGIINREKLLAFGGRQRNPQFELANNLGITGFSQPAGGCLLTDPAFTRRLKDLIKHKQMNLEAIDLLKLGRHFRITDDAKFIVARNELEGIALEKMAPEGSLLFYPHEQIAGPTSLAIGKLSQDLLELSARITCFYCDLNGAPDAEIILKRTQQEEKVRLKVSPASQEEIERLRI